MYNGPQTDRWYVAPGIFKAYSLAGIGGGAFIFYFWNQENDMVYTYGFAGAGGVKTSLKLLGLAGKYDGGDVGDWLPVERAKPFSPEDLDGAVGRMEKLGLSIMGIGITTCRTGASKGTTGFFGDVKVDIKNTGVFKFPAMALVGKWELLDANKQTGTMTRDWDKFVNGE